MIMKIRHIKTCGMQLRQFLEENLKPSKAYIRKGERLMDDESVHLKKLKKEQQIKYKEKKKKEENKETSRNANQQH